MAYLLGAALAVVVVLVVALYRQQVSHLNHLTLLWTKTEAERRALLDRIQHPGVRQIDREPVAPVEPPRDAAEFAHIGQVVPEFVHVGTEVTDG